MATITPADLGRAVYKFGGYYKKASDMNSVLFHSSSSGAIVPKSSSGKYFDAMSDKDKHFVQVFDPFSFSLVEDVAAKLHTEDVRVYNLRMLPAGADDTQKIVYLPYYDMNITSTTIPPGEDSVRYFMTDKLSGCKVYIDQREDGELVCYHANAQHKPVGEAEATMDTMHNSAQERGDVNKASLGKDVYYAKALELEREIVAGQTDRKFSGGTTVMGFRVDDEWEFWFQTYGRLTYVSTGGKELLLQDVPLRIIDYGRFWPK